jgi:hypothetical protein
MAHGANGGAGFNQMRFPHDGNIFRSRDRIFGKTGFAGREKEVRGMVRFVDAGRKWNHEDCVCPLVTIAGIKRNDHYRTSSFLWRIDGQLDEPDLPPEGRFDGWRHLDSSVHELGQREFSPRPFLRLCLLGKTVIKACNRLLHGVSFSLVVERAKKVIQNSGDRSSSRTLAHRA